MREGTHDGEEDGTLAGSAEETVRGTGGRDDAGEGDAFVDETDDPFAEFDEIDDVEATPDEIDELFEPIETSELDDEAVWEAVLSEEGGESAGTDPVETGVDAVVPINQYCKRCEFFSDPPDVACAHPGTEIAELVGVDRFRVTNCPVVARRGRAKDTFSDDR